MALTPNPVRGGVASILGPSVGVWEVETVRQPPHQIGPRGDQETAGDLLESDHGGSALLDHGGYAVRVELAVRRDALGDVV